jgi:hypothetical protein
MRRKKLLLLLTSWIMYAPLQAQYRERFEKYPYSFFQQTDSIYKANKVKSRTTILSEFSAGKMVHELTMNRQGLVVNIMYPPYMSVQTWHTQFTYTDSGKLSGVQDVFIKSKEGAFYQNLIRGDKKLMKKYNDMPAKIYYRYFIDQQADTLKSITRINEKGDTISQSKFLNNGRSKQYREFGKYGTDADITYLSNPFFVYQPVSLAYKNMDTPYLIKYEYFTNEKNQVNRVIIRSYSFNEPEPYSTEAYQLSYDENGLLLKVGGRYTSYLYNYTFYK